MFGIGAPELILILIIGLVVFGPGKLPEAGRAVGKSLSEFKKAASGIMGQDSNEAEPAQKAGVPVKNAPADSCGDKNKSATGKEGGQK